MKKQNTKWGHGLALFTAFVWGTSFIATKTLLVNLTPLEILFFRFAFGYAALWIIYPHKLKLKERKEEVLLCLAGLSGVTLYFLCENIALSLTQASNVGVLVSVAPFFTGMLAFIAGLEKIGRYFLAGFILSITGIVLISYSGSTQLSLNPLGDALAVVAAVFWAVYTIFTKKVCNKHPYPMIAITRKIFFYGILTMLPCMFFMDFSVSNITQLSFNAMARLLYLGLISSAICYITWNKSMNILGAVKTSSYIYLIPLITLLFSIFLLKEQLTVVSIIGVVFILSGLVISERGTREKEKSASGIIKEQNFE